MDAPVVYQVSASKVYAWLDCPRKFWFRYPARHRVNGSWAHLSMGLAMHAVLRDWWDQPVRERDATTVANLMAEHWSDQGFRDVEQSRQWQRSATSMAWGYLRSPASAAVPASRERTLATRIGHVVINARIDRIDKINLDPGAGHLAVIDYKTGKRVPGQDEVRGSIALALYAICVSRALHQPCSRVELHHVPSATAVTWDHTELALQRHLTRVLDIAEEMRSAEAQACPNAPAEDQSAFPARPGPLCGWCDFHHLCPEGQQASPKQVPWAGLPEAADDTPALGDPMDWSA